MRATMERMRRLAVLALGVTLVLGACSPHVRPACTGPPPELTLHAGGERLFLPVQVADTPAEREQGLMGSSQLAANHGMAFVYDAPSTDGFWMKDTEIPLSIAFWGVDMRIQQIFDMQPCSADPCRVYRASAPFAGALEVSQGYFSAHGVEIGDKVQLFRGGCG